MGFHILKLDNGAIVTTQKESASRISDGKLQLQEKENFLGTPVSELKTGFYRVTPSAALEFVGEVDPD